MRCLNRFNAVILAASAMMLSGGKAMSYESIYPRTPVGTIEIKTLPSRTTLVASAPGDAFNDRGSAFRKLFNYINANQVAMSVPVEASASTNEMVFFVGSNGTARALAATNGVSVRTMPETTVASIGLRGSYSRANYDAGLKRLSAWLSLQREWRTNGAPYAVYWNSPFTLWFLRKSEIHVPLSRAAPSAPAFYTFEVETIDGTRTNLALYQGKVVLVMNVASKCGFTKQYAGLQKLYETYRERGLVLLGFPSNDFLGQEPGTNEEIQQFCSLNYGVTFPIFGKIKVKGDEKHRLYAWLTDNTLHPGLGGEVSWNFNKFLVGRDGTLIARFGSRTTPDAPDLIAAIEKALQPK
jgi:glutathione peroxidase